MPEVRIVERAALSPPELADLLGWGERAYDEGPWRPAHWDDIGPGLHLMIEDDRGLAAHACLDWMPVSEGDTELQAGYMEDVAVGADRRGEGLGTGSSERRGRFWRRTQIWGSWPRARRPSTNVRFHTVGHVGIFER